MEMEERWEQNSSLKTLICCFLTKCFSICAQLQLLKEKKKEREKENPNNKTLLQNYSEQDTLVPMSLYQGCQQLKATVKWDITQLFLEPK